MFGLTSYKSDQIIANHWAALQTGWIKYIVFYIEYANPKWESDVIELVLIGNKTALTRTSEGLQIKLKIISPETNCLPDSPQEDVHLASSQSKNID